jgi:hypothetical protein
VLLFGEEPLHHSLEAMTGAAEPKSLLPRETSFSNERNYSLGNGAVQYWSDISGQGSAIKARDPHFRNPLVE